MFVTLSPYILDAKFSQVKMALIYLYNVDSEVMLKQEQFRINKSDMYFLEVEYVATKEESIIHLQIHSYIYFS